MGGHGYARLRAEEQGVDGLVDAFCAKDLRDADGCYRTRHLPTGGGQAVFVDDRPEDLARSLAVIAVSPYLSDDPFDRAFEEVARRAGLA